MLEATTQKYSKRNFIYVTDQNLKPPCALPRGMEERKIANRQLQAASWPISSF